VDALTILVCEEHDEDPPAATRAEWLREIHPTAEVVVLPSHGLDPHDSALWARHTLDTLGWRPDRVFTSERYGDAYAPLMGAEHVLVDLDRVAFPISGTDVRRDPLAAWDFPEPPVRAHYARRVVVVGAESTGTTTLAHALALL